MTSWRCVFVVLIAALVAGCSGTQLQTAISASPAEAAQASASDGPPPASMATPVSTLHTAVPDEPPSAIGTDLPSATLVRDTVSSRLFSKAEDDKPWPKEGSQEWRREKARDALREHELERHLRICQGC